MFITLIILFLYGCVTVQCSNPKIVNGSNAEENEFLYVVSLRRNDHHICGGTILTNKFILTAAHCICQTNMPINPKEYSIQYGLVRITTENRNRIQVKRINCHDYSPITGTYDSAILELLTNLPNDGQWEPVQLARNFDTSIEHKGIIVGWGQTAANNRSVSEYLQKLDVDVYDNKVCGKHFKIAHHICLGAQDAGACYGDSGTCLIVEGKQVGIASFITHRCGIATKTNPNVYSRVDTYYPWIKSITKLD